LDEVDFFETLLAEQRLAETLPTDKTGAKRRNMLRSRRIRRGQRQRLFLRRRRQRMLQR
jgi:hypothetical protein